MVNVDFESELLKRKIVTSEQLQTARSQSKNFGSRLTSAIIALGYAEPVATAHVVADVYKLKTANLRKMNLSLDLKNYFSKEQCETYFVVPIYRTSTEMVIAISDPFVLFAKEHLEAITKHKITPVVCTEENIRLAIDLLYNPEMSSPPTSDADEPNTATFVNFIELRSERSPNSILVSPVGEFVLPTVEAANAGDVAPAADHRPAPITASATTPVAPAPKTPAPAPAQKIPVPAPKKPAAPTAPLMALKGDVTQIVNTIINEAIKHKSSDIHIEQFEKKYRVRYRIDGLMQEAFQPTTGLSTELVSRIKVISKLDLSEKRRPQDGRIKFQVGSDKFIDLRVSILPTLFGEKVVLRILDKSNLEKGIQSLGFSEQQLQLIENGIQKPQGMILVTGPTGSGKTTTLYSILHELNEISANIATAEDPVEFYIDGINQVQINHDIGFTFADSLRAFLRQDPDVIMVGEIRDTETANVAYKAASTGHLVLSTLHTNDALSTVYRLIDMEVPKYIVAAGTTMIVAQRLLKKNCSHCAIEENISPDLLRSLGVPDKQLAEFAHTQAGQGCSDCNNTGLKGRVAIHEVLDVSGPIRNAIAAGVPMQELKRIAASHGMITLRMRALELLKQGVVCYQEVFSGTVSDDGEESASYKKSA